MLDQARSAEKWISPMVKVYSEDGTGVLFEEPPYTWEEEQDFYRRMSGGPKVVLHAPAVKKPEKPKRSKSIPPAE
jgi:hypothetical protein